VQLQASKEVTMPTGTTVEPIGLTGAQQPIGLIEAGQVPLLARPFFADGDPGPIVAALAQVPELLMVAAPLLGVALSPSAIDWRTKEIVIVRTSALAGCRYCIQAHTTVALDAGLSHDEVAALRIEAPVEDVFDSERELALLRWIDVVARAHGPVADDDRTDIRSHFSDHEIVELTAVIGVTLLLNRFATSLALPSGPDTLRRLAQENFL